MSENQLSNGNKTLLFKIDKLLNSENQLWNSLI